jgi:glycosyltransferase involved in cell wall biosynthesis
MKLSIITINFNNLDGLKCTVESVINQSWRHFEFIVIDGGSNDGSAEFIFEKKRYLTFWESKPDNGIYHAMNKGIELANGEYLLFLNSGDTLKKDVLKRIFQIELFGDLVFFDYYDLTTKKLISGSIKKLDFEYLFKSCPKHQAIFLKKELFKDELYNEDLKIVSDWEFLLKKFCFSNISLQPVPICIANTDEEGISAKNIDLLIHERSQVLKGIFGNKVVIELERLYNENLILSSKFIKLFINLRKKFLFNE